MPYLFFDQLNLGASRQNRENGNMKLMTMRQHFGDVILASRLSKKFQTGIFFFLFSTNVMLNLVGQMLFTLFWAYSMWGQMPIHRWIDFFAINCQFKKENATCTVRIWHTRSVVWNLCQAAICVQYILNDDIWYFDVIHSRYFFGVTIDSSHTRLIQNRYIDWWSSLKWRTNNHKSVLTSEKKELNNSETFTVTLRQFIQRENSFFQCRLPYSFLVNEIHLLMVLQRCHTFDMHQKLKFVKRERKKMKAAKKHCNEEKKTSNKILTRKWHWFYLV